MTMATLDLGATDTYRERRAAWVSWPRSSVLGVLTVTTVGKAVATTTYMVGWVSKHSLLLEPMAVPPMDDVPAAIAAGRERAALRRKAYTVTVQPWGGPTCTCEGFMTGRCKHADAIAELVRRGIIEGHGS
jgi:hypothetical protein